MNTISSILRRIMELWKVYRFVGYVRKHEDDGIEYNQLKEQYRTKKNLTEADMNRLWKSAFTKYVSVDDGIHAQLTHEGRLLTDLHGTMFLSEVSRLFSPLLQILFGGIGLALISLFYSLGRRLINLIPK